MLLRFSASNFGSLRDEQELSMIASRAIKDDPSGLIGSDMLRNEKVLPAAVIYGANASGKSNFVKAMAHMQDLIRNSHRRSGPGEPVPLKPFLLDPTYEQRPSAFRADFLLNGARYSYGFEATQEKFITENLYVWRGGPRTMLFERTNQTFDFGRNLKGRNKTIEDLTRPNSLFLSAAAQNNHEDLTEVADFFRLLSFDLAYHPIFGLSTEWLAVDALAEKVLSLLKVIDVGVIDFLVQEEMPSHAEINLRVAFRSALAEKWDLLNLDQKPFLDWKNQPVRFGHRAVDGQTKFFDIEDESAGTVQLLSILPPIAVALGLGTVVVIDEFGSRLHTRAAEMILSLFNSKETNPKGAQLIVATHDTNLLNAKGLRRDQVWFTEKDPEGATHLYPLTDIETRKGDNLEKGYLQGRYGAIPFAGAPPRFAKAD